MKIYGEELHLKTNGFSDIHDITQEVAEIVEQADVAEGLANISAIGSTASISTMEFEPALAQDIRDNLEELAPKDKPTRHGDTWGDDNGFAHIRSTLMGPGITVPIHHGRLVLGTWQQIVAIDHDNRPRDRRVFVQVIGQ
ncbi:YjbQ family protein [Candidatus Sumerlaeota bacterium]|nr:YjbQ family protein [Candidatus Sumerlaeota bacterium]